MPWKPKIKFEYANSYNSYNTYTSYNQKYNNTYHFDPSKNYLIYYKGCFALPHRGHFDTANRFLEMGSNIKVLLNQMDNDRHGVPYPIKRNIWKTYINDLMIQSRVWLRSYHHFEDIMNEDLTDIDVIVFIRGIEDEEKDARKVKKRLYKRHRDVGNWLKDMGIQLDFYYLARPEVKTLCATEFTRTLIAARHLNDNDKYYKCKRFLPKGLSRTKGLQIINNLQRLNLWV